MHLSKAVVDDGCYSPLVDISGSKNILHNWYFYDDY